MWIIRITYAIRAPKSGNLGLMFMQNEEWKIKNYTHCMFAACCWFQCCTYLGRHNGVWLVTTCVQFSTLFSAVCMRFKTSHMYSFCDRFPCHWMHPISICIREFVSFRFAWRLLAARMLQNCHRLFVSCLSQFHFWDIWRYAQTFYFVSINHCCCLFVESVRQITQGSHELVSNNTQQCRAFNRKF